MRPMLWSLICVIDVIVITLMVVRRRMTRRRDVSNPSQTGGLASCHNMAVKDLKPRI